MDPIVLLSGQGERIAAGASIAIMKATADATGGAFSMSEATFPAGMSCSFGRLRTSLRRHEQTD